MVTYVYVCKFCEFAEERREPITSKVKVRRCPNCKQRGLERQIGGGMALIFKGPGFYITDKRAASKT